MSAEPILINVPILSRSSAVIGDTSPDRSPTMVHRPTMPPHGRSPMEMTGSGSVLSIGSAGSVLSIGSAGSILSIGSAGSVLSIGSAGSILSVGSAASVCSVGSIMSVGSLGSIGAVGGRGQIAGRLVDTASTALGVLALGTAVFGLWSDSV